MSDGKKIKDFALRLNTYIIQFIYEEGNGWAFVNALSPSQAETVFKTQTRYAGAKVVSTKETKYYGENMQVVFEGAVTTVSNTSVISNINNLVDAALIKYDFTSIIQDAVEAKFKDLNLEDLLDIDLTNYYTKSEIQGVINTAISKIHIPDVSQFVTTQQLQDAIDAIEVINGKDGKDGEDGIDGQDGVGISEISYSEGILTITTTNGTPYSFNIAVGGGGSGDSVIIEVTSIGKGPMTGTNSAYARATSPGQSTVNFQWIQDEIVDGVRIRKLWWHVGNGIFIDALGYELDTNPQAS